MTLESIQKHTLTTATLTTTATANLTDAPNAAYCVPIGMMRVVTANGDEYRDYVSKLDILTAPDPDQVEAERRDATSTPSIVHEVDVLEFDSTKFDVYKGTASITENAGNVTAAIGATVDPTKAVLFFTYRTNSTSNWWRAHRARGQITDANGAKVLARDSVYFDTQTGQGAPGIEVSWAVVVCKNTEWSVTEQDLQLTNTNSSVQATSLGLTANKTAVFGSYWGADGPSDSDSPADNLVDVNLSGDGNTLTVQRNGTDQDIWWSGFLVTFSGSETVHRGTLTWSVSETSKTDIAIGSTVSDNTECTVHAAGVTGMLGVGRSADTDGNASVDHMIALTFTDDSNLTATHNPLDSTTGIVLSWEVIEWDVGSAPATPGRRVMVR